MHMNKRHENGGSRPTRTAAKRIGRVFLPICLLVLVAVVAVGGTMAYITDSTQAVINTFTVGDVNITLTETEFLGKDANGKDSYASAPAEGVDNSYPMVPGKKYTKDPKVTVVTTGDHATNIPIYLFVEMIEENDAADYLIYTPTLTTGNRWTQGDGTNIPSNVWYRTVKPTDTELSWNLLENDEITVNSNTVLETNMETAAAAKLSFKAYAIQTENLEPAAAWAAVKNLYRLPPDNPV